MRNRIIISALGAALAMGALPAAADTSSISGTAQVQGGSATVSGTAVIAAPEAGPLGIGGAVTPFAGAPSPQALPNEMTGADIELLDDGLRFTWYLEDLPEVVPPEGIRYTWSFRAGDQTFQLQAKSSNLASITTAEDPVGHGLQAASGEEWFQLRGACQAQYQGTPTAGCYHLAFLDGEFDAEADTVTIDMPFGTTDKIGRLVADSFRRGVEIVPELTAGASITASAQAVVSTTTMGSFITDWTSVFTGPTVQLGVGRPGVNPTSVSYSSTATLNPDGTFTGTVSGLTTTNSAVYARACHGLKSACTAIEVPRG